MRRSVALATLVLGGLLAASAASAQVVQITSNVSANSSWGPTGSVVGTIFWVKNSISIDAAATLNIQPGVIVKFNPGCQLTVNGRLKSIGTGASNIYFTSYRDDGLGIEFRSELEELKWINRRGRPVKSLYILRALATDVRASKPLKDTAEVYVYRP